MHGCVPPARPRPTRRQWIGASLLGGMIFVVDYGCLFWAEQRVPSGIAAVVLATIPVFITLFEIVLLRTMRLSLGLAFSLLLGIAGVAILMSNSFSLGQAPIDRAGAAALLLASFTWSIATVITRKTPLPESKAMSSATQMLSGGAQLIVVSALDRRVLRIPSACGFLECVVRAGVFDRGRIDHWLHRLRVVAALRISHQSRELTPT